MKLNAVHSLKIPVKKKKTRKETVHDMVGVKTFFLKFVLDLRMLGLITPFVHRFMYSRVDLYKCEH